MTRSIAISALKREELDEVLEIELRKVQERVFDSTERPLGFRMTDSGREFLLVEGTDQRYGARNLKRAIERYLVGPPARLLSTEQLQAGDFLLIDRHPGERGLAFRKDKEQHFFHFQTCFVPSIPIELALVQAGAQVQGPGEKP